MAFESITAIGCSKECFAIFEWYYYFNILLYILPANMFLFLLLALISLESESAGIAPLGDPPGYIQAQREIKNAVKILKVNVM